LWGIPDKKEKEEEWCRCFGLLKVELSSKDAPSGSYKSVTPFDERHQSFLKALAAWLCERLPDQRCRDFWRWFAQRSAAQNAQHLMAVMRNWRSAEYNITEGLGYTLEFFRTFAGSDHALLVLRYPWSEAGGWHAGPQRVYIMPYWRPCWEKRVFDPPGELGSKERKSIPRPAFCSSAGNDWDNRKRLTLIKLEKDPAKTLSGLLTERGGVGAVREADLDIRVSLPRKVDEAKKDEGIKLEVEDMRQSPKPKREYEDRFIEIKSAWLVELRAGHSDFGTIILQKVGGSRSGPGGKQPPSTASGEGRPAGEQPPGTASGGSSDPMIRNLASHAVSLSRVLDRILGSGAGLKEGACLPAERPASSRKLVFGFADIRNFSTVTRILRLMGPRKLPAIELFMEHFCRVMARLANDWGRLDKFVADGMVVFFGEDLLPVRASEDPEEDADPLNKSVLNSVCFAIAALKAFKEISNAWLHDDLSEESLPWRFPHEIRRPLLKNIRAEHCEEIDLNLGVALNLGTVFMDYFGDTHGRAYSAIGDNVNLCARICNEAAKRDDRGHERAPILITQPVFEYLKNYLTKEAQERETVRLQPRGLGLDYPIREILTKDLEFGEVKRAYVGTRYRDLLEDTLQFSGGDWSLTGDFIKGLALKK
jgi:class 3 adenylate cyclase